MVKCILECIIMKDVDELGRLVVGVFIRDEKIFL